MAAEADLKAAGIDEVSSLEGGISGAVYVVFKNNRANKGHGGGYHIGNVTGTVNFSNVVLVNNYAEGQGGGGYAFNSTMMLSLRKK
mgnify:CR=1 FL=1